MDQAANRIRFRVVGKREALFPAPADKPEIRAWEIELQPELGNIEGGIMFPPGQNGGPPVLGVVTTNEDVAAAYKVGEHAPAVLEWSPAVIRPKLEILGGRN